MILDSEKKSDPNLSIQTYRTNKKLYRIIDFLTQRYQNFAFLVMAV
jgi:hypothetical protein